MDHNVSTFADPIANKRKPAKSPFNAPTKEGATTGRFMQAGDDYGVGHRQPVGRQGNPKQRVDVLPFDHRKGMSLDAEL